ncbi:hypothetical protein Tco_0738515 [Tanacetum coccineum]
MGADGYAYPGCMRSCPNIVLQLVGPLGACGAMSWSVCIDIHCHIALLSTVEVLAKLFGLRSFCCIPEFLPLSGCDRLVIRAKIMLPRMRTRSAGRPAAESLGGGTGEWVGRGGRGRIPTEGNDERVDELNGQGNDQGLGANGGVEGVNGNVEGANGGAPNFSTIIAQQL